MMPASLTSLLAAFRRWESESAFERTIRRRIERNRGHMREFLEENPIRQVPRPKPTEAEVLALADAVWQVLDDMGKNGRSCCPAAKAQLRVAYEPLRAAELEVDYSLQAATALLLDLDRTS